MKTRSNPQLRTLARPVAALALLTFLLPCARVQAQPTLVSSVPANGASGVSTTGGVVFTFSEPMDTSATAAIFLTMTPFAELTTTAAWSAGNTVLTCTPAPAFPGNSEISWYIGGQDLAQNSLDTNGAFATGAGGGGTAVSGTNKYTSFAVGEAIYYDQTNSGTPALNTAPPPYYFFADVTLSSNQSALSATVELPSTSVSNLNQGTEPGQFLVTADNSSQAALNGTFGNGNYVFTVNAPSSNEQVTVNLPGALAQPGVPQISNYTAAQSVNPAQPFTLTWNPFVGGAVTDCVFVTIGNVFTTPPPTSTNELPGTATSVVIPASTLLPNSVYDCFISFYHLILPSNTLADGYATVAYRYTSTEFTLSTTSASTTPVILTNASWSGHTFSFNVTSAVGQSLTIQYNTNAAPLPGHWQTLLATTNTTGVLPVSDSVNTTNKHIYYRVAIGP